MGFITRVLVKYFMSRVLMNIVYVLSFIFASGLCLYEGFHLAGLLIASISLFLYLCSTVAIHIYIYEFNDNKTFYFMIINYLAIFVAIISFVMMIYGVPVLRVAQGQPPKILISFFLTLQFSGWVIVNYDIVNSKEK